MKVTKGAKLAIQILALLMIAAISFCFLADWMPETDFVTHSMEQVEENKETIIKFETSTLAAALAITTLPDDIGTPYAEFLTDINIYFVLLLAILFLERILLLFGFQFAFSYAIPIACAVCILSLLTRKDALKSLAVRICILAAAAAFAVPCSTALTDVIAADLTTQMEAEIALTEEDAEKFSQATTVSTDNKTVFNKLSALFDGAIQNASDVIRNLKTMVTRCVNSIAIMILKTFVIPVLTFFFLKWILNETFHIFAPVPPIRIVQPKELDDSCKASIK